MSETPPNAPPSGQPHIRTIVMPADTNPAGDIFDGWLMSQRDLAVGDAAARCIHGRCTTVAMSFHAPVKVGDEARLSAEAVGTGRTSLRIKVEAWRSSPVAEASARVTSVVSTFVALDVNGQPWLVPAEAS